MRREPADRVAEPAPDDVAPVDRTSARLVAGMLAAPLAWLLHLVVSYALVGPACEGEASWVHHVVTLAALALALPGGVLAWQAWRGSPPEDSPGAPARHRTQFLAIAGVVNAVFFSLIILLSWSAAIALAPCPPP